MTDTPGDRRIERNLLIDADDTLWENNVYYLRTTARYLDHLESLGLDRERGQEILSVCEREVIPTHGYSPQGYIAALGMCCRRLADEAGVELPEGAVEDAMAVGDAILEPPMVLREGAAYTLRALRPSSRLVLVTKGDPDYQARKIERSGLGPLLDARYILAEKDPAAYRRIVAELDLDPHTTWMVGNSPKSDINPAVRAGLGAILIPHERTWGYELERLERPELVVTLRSLCELLDFFGVDGECDQ